MFKRKRPTRFRSGKSADPVRDVDYHQRRQQQWDSNQCQPLEHADLLVLLVHLLTLSTSPLVGR
jgi:hypothetical protein